MLICCTVILLFHERALSTRCTDIQMIAGFRRSAGERRVRLLLVEKRKRPFPPTNYHRTRERLPAVPGGLVPPEREDQSAQRKSDKIKAKGAARGVAAAA